MNKTLAVILHYNTPQYTDVLYELLESEQKSGNYNLLVIDNGSDKDKTSKYTSIEISENIFFGGAMDVLFKDINSGECGNGEYDSLLFLNSDLIVGKNFVSSLRKKLDEGYDVISPCIIQPEKTQNHWNQMLPWGSKEIRSVRWIDLQAPMISKRLIDYICENGGIDHLFLRGWGIDVWFGILCEKLNWKTGVCDYVPAIHLGSMTMKALGNVNEYCRLAEQGMYEFFNKNDLMNEFIDMRKWAENYKI
jgi:hypothetical protein